MVLAFKVCYIAWAHCIYFEINAKYFFLVIKHTSLPSGV